MNELKPIKEGCLALTFNCDVASNNGKVVRVGGFLTDFSLRWGERMWDTDTKTVSTVGVISTWMHEINLLRIDDPDLKEEKEEELVYIEDGE